eukprot:GGOE01056267.1.p2 GENE.GGOE01056267.1~~GGOE01056267.1.p2  ORF type:complete len:149 (+),score=57.18 GGOE01056267.1:60-506(+)
MIYTLYIFNRSGSSMFFHDWHRRKRPVEGSKELAEELSLMGGLLYSLKQFVRSVSPQGDGDSMTCFRTNKFRLHHFESPAGIRFAITTDLLCPDLRTELRYIYSALFVEHVVRDPMHTAGSPITNPAFREAVDKFVQKLPHFSTSGAV